MLHTLAHIGMYIAVCFAIISSGGGAAIVIYSMVLLASATDGIAITPRGNFTVPKKDIGIVWEAPLMLVCLGLFWALIAVGLGKL